MKKNSDMFAQNKSNNIQFMFKKGKFQGKIKF